MKLLHVSDIHIGRTIGGFDLIDDQRYILDQIIDIAEKDGVDAILIAGDVYDKAVPGESAVKLLDYFLCRLAEKGMDTFIISGNHDSDERMNFGSSLFQASNIFISAKYEGRLLKRTVTDSQGAVNIYLMPFIKASQVRHFFPDEEIATYDDAVRVVLKKSAIDPQERNILVAHQFVAGKTAEPQLGGSESVSTQKVGLVEKIGWDCFDAFDYVALGHIHSPQPVGRNEIRYAGSPLKYSRSEAGDDKSVTIAELGEKGKVRIEQRPLRPMRDLRHVRGRMDQLLAKENITAPDDFIYATLTDEDAKENVMGIFQQYYPNTVAIEYDNSHTRQLQQPDLAEIAENKSFDDIISDFYKLIYGCEISDDERKLMKETAREAGIVDEAD